MRFAEYFTENNQFRFIDHVRSGEHPWSALVDIKKLITRETGSIEDSGISKLKDSIRLDKVTSLHGEVKETALSVIKSIVLPHPIHISSAGILIEEGVYLEYGAIIKAPCIIMKNTEIRQGAYLRGDVIIGEGCVVGHVSEVKNSIFMDHSHAGHFAYVGDSILGSHVNLGAGTKLANLQFRTRGEIETDALGVIVIRSGDGLINTGLYKLGAVIGDYTEIGCNTVTSPGVCAQSDCWIYPNTTVPKGFYQRKSIIRARGAGVVDVSSRPDIP
ncbi:MAG: hypothetical protein HY751_00630 [Nitrospinae bacterium]|nr:hypothetical protein [Nitrospinota bacterium]